MQTRKSLSLFLLIVVLILAACSTPKTPQTMAEKPNPTATEAMMEKESTATPETMMEKESTATPETMMEKESTATPEAMMEEKKDNDMMADEKKDDAMTEEEKKDDTMKEPPAWFGVTLANVQTGETFTINDLKGKVILVENLAQWCSNCKKQQQQVLALTEQLGNNPDVILLGLDIDPNATDQSLQSYIQSNGFTWWYAVAPIEVTREISQTLGDQFLNPPSTPMFIIDQHGEIHPLGFGIKSADDLMKALQQFLDGEM